MQLNESLRKKNKMQCTRIAYDDAVHEILFFINFILLYFTFCCNMNDIFSLEYVYGELVLVLVTCNYTHGSVLYDCTGTILEK